MWGPKEITGRTYSDDDIAHDDSECHMDNSSMPPRKIESRFVSVFAGRYAAYAIDGEITKDFRGILSSNLCCCRVRASILMGSAYVCPARI